MDAKLQAELRRSGYKDPIILEKESCQQILDILVNHVNKEKGHAWNLPLELKERAFKQLAPFKHAIKLVRDGLVPAVRR